MIPRKVSQEIEIWMRDKKFGSLQLNFRDGRITNVNKTECLKVEFIGNVENVSASITTNDAEVGKLD